MAYKEIYTKPDGGIPDSDIASASAWNNKVPSTRKVNGKALSSDIALTASDVGALPTSGGSLTGNLTVGSSSIGTNGYVEGTWLRTTKATESAGDFATINGGWIYKRAPANVLGDIGGQAKITANGILKGDGTGTITAADETEVELVDLPQEIFWATYGETTYAEVKAAVDSGKDVKLKFNNSGLIYDYSGTAGSGYYYLFSVIYPYTGNADIRGAQISNQGWETLDIGSILDTRQSIYLSASSWAGSDPYTQTVTLYGLTKKTQVDIQPSETIYDQLVSDGVRYLAIKNDNGTFTAIAKGGKPSVDLTVQGTAHNVY